MFTRSIACEFSGPNNRYRRKYRVHSNSLVSKLPASTRRCRGIAPESRSRLLHNVKINGFDDRVSIYPFAAGVSNGDGFLTDDGLKSSLVAGPGIGRIPIKIVDFFGLAGSEPVDILKIDCEGGEYQILMDPRFESFHARALVMEWHNSRERPRAGKEIMERLVALGWHLESLGDDLAQCDTGTVWAYR